LILRCLGCLASLALLGAVAVLLQGFGGQLAAAEQPGWTFTKEPEVSLAYRLPRLKADAFRAICQSGTIGPEIPVTLRLDTGTHRDGISVDVGFQSEGFVATYVSRVNGKGVVKLPLGIEDPLWTILKTKERLSFGLTGLEATAIPLKGAPDVAKAFLDVCRAQFAAADAATPEGKLSEKTFACEDGTVLRARFDNSRAYSVALISQDGKPEVPLIQVESGSGAKYSNGDYTLHTKGDGAQLSRGKTSWRCQVK
jgi:membrane-bound inhibitor of C-type lysozyme